MRTLLIFITLLTLGGLAWWLIAPYFITTQVQDELDPAIAALLDDMPSAPSRPVVVTVSESGEQMIMPLAETDIVEVPMAVDPNAPMVRGPFTIADTRGHPASGEVTTIITPDQQLVRFQDYQGTNGPDLFIYLAKDLEANEFVNLGRAKGNQGNINYVVPEDIDISEYKYVMTWCRAFGVLFDFAEIN